MDRLVFRLGQPRPEGLPDILRLGLNPPEMTLKRHANLVARPAAPFGRDPAVGYAGPPETRLEMRLLVEAGTDPITGEPADVRVLTDPLKQLAGRPVDGLDTPCPIDLIWGKHWTFRGALTRFSERLDAFTASGRATRNWLQLEFLQIPMLNAPLSFAAAPLPEPILAPSSGSDEASGMAPEGELP